MDYKQFISTLSRTSDIKKSDFMRKHLTKKYVSYITKVAEAKEIIHKSSYIKIKDKETFMQNSPTAYMLFIIRLFVLYTDITWEEEEVIQAFDAFCENGVVELLVSAISPKEFDSFNTILQMVKDDEYENYRSLAGFFDSKVDALGITLNALAEATEKIEVTQK